MSIYTYQVKFIVIPANFMQMQTSYIYAIMLGMFLCLQACNRNTSSPETATEEVNTEQPKITNVDLISPEDPFKNQPNALCTVIRKLDISYYAPEQNVDDITAYPKKYCLLDVCLNGPSSNGNIVNLGGEDEIVTSSYELIKVFNSVDEVKAYVEKFKISDVVYEE